MSQYHMAEMTSESLRARFPQYLRYGSKLDRAIEVVLSGGVKEHRFLPSGRRIFTVVGNLGDEFVDPEKPYCSCSHFYFRVLGHKDETCYHLLSYKIASACSMVDTITFSDEEYSSVFAAVALDVFHILERGGNP